MSIDRLTAELRAGGTAEGEGAFSLDREKAREKLRQFQLADPHRYVLLFVQALVARGATSILIDMDADDLRIVADGTPLGTEDFDELYSSMYAAGRARPGLRELALASNAVMALNPRYVRIDSGDGRQGVRLELRVGKDDRIEPLASAPVGTRVHVKERFRPGLLVRFLRVKTLPEQVHVRERCRWADVAISLGEARISGGIATMLPGATEVGSGSLRGWFAFDPVGGVGVLHVLRWGVLVAQHELPHPQFAGARAVLVGDHMRTDASMSDVVRDSEYDAWTAALGVSHHKTTSEWLAAALASGAVLPPAWLDIVRERVGGWLSTTPAVLENPAYAPWFAVPLWQSLGQGPTTTAQIAAHAGEIRISSEAPVGAAPKEIASYLFVTSDQDREALKRMFGARVVDRTTTVTRVLRRLANRDAFTRRPHPTRLPDERHYSARVAIAAEGITGEVGLASDGAQRSFLRVIVQGCMLVEIPAELGLPSVHAVVEGGFTPMYMYDAVTSDAKLAAAVLAVMGAVDSLARSLALAVGAMPAAEVEDGVEGMLSSYLVALVNDRLDVDALASVGFSEKFAQQHVREAARPWKFDRSRDLAADSTHPLVRMPIATDGAGQPLSLVDIAAALERDGKIRAIALARPIVREPPRLVVRAGKIRLAMLKSIFGQDAVELAGTEFDRWIARDRRCRTTAEQELAVSACTVGPQPFVDGARRGVVGLAEQELELEERRATVAVWVDLRPMCRLHIPCGLPGIEVAIDVEPELADANFKGLANRDAFEQVGRSAIAGIAQLIPAVVGFGRGTRVPSHNVQRFVVAVAQLAWSVPPLLRAWLSLRRELGDDDGAKAYAELLELLEQHAFDDVIAAIRERLDQSVVPLPQMIGPALPPRVQPAGMPWTTLRQSAAAQITAALTIPCLITLSGSSVPLSRIVDAVANGTPVRWVPANAGHEPQPEFEDVLLLDRDVREAVAAFAGEAMVDAVGALAFAVRRRSFEQRAELAHLIVAPSRAIVRISLTGPDVQGELGIPTHAPDSGEPGELLVCHGRRPIHTIAPVELPWIGVVSGDFGSDSGFEQVSSDDRRRIAEVCKAHVPAMLRAIAQAWREIDEQHQGIVRAWALQLLGSLAAGSGGEPVALAAHGIAELAMVPLFMDTQFQPRTLDALYVDWRAHGDVLYARQLGLVGERIVVHVSHQAEILALGQLFGSVRDYAEEHARRAKLADRLREAPQMPVVPADALAVFTVDGRGLVGKIWIDDDVGDETAVSFGRDGRVVGEQRISSMFPCKGAITGPELDIAEDWSGFELSGPQQNQLKNDACSLWESLVHEGMNAEALDERRARPLRNLLLRLHAIPTARRSWPNHDQRKLYRELRKVPLFPVASGHSISLTVALREKPAELDRLGLWNPRDRDAKPEAPAAEPAPSEAPAPEPVPTRPLEPAERLLAAVRDELRLVRAHAPDLLAEIHLERLTIRALDGTCIASWQGDGAVVLDGANEVVAHALREPDVLLVAILASATFTTLNCALADVTDAHELDFLRWHAAHARTVRRS